MTQNNLQAHLTIDILIQKEKVYIINITHESHLFVCLFACLFLYLFMSYVSIGWFNSASAGFSLCKKY